ncbi:MAG: bifunctional 5,10-methylene-tetrahydrofolate dehydrogenase/5,10-methylene-tetrahydrofolate cyclohydrolase, partial [Candidatus Limnocylindrales bacterium]
GLLALGYEGYLPATAHASVELLKRSGIELAGAHAAVVGRSNVIGKPVAQLLLREHATVTMCHSRTPDLGAVLRQADIVVVAAGRPRLVTGEMLKPGAVVVDVGINVVEDALVGDVDYDSAVQVASAITPVPGGVGPLTNAILLNHLMLAARDQADRHVAVGAPSVRTS